MMSLSTENLSAAGSTYAEPARHSLSRVRRYAARELEYARMGAPGLHAVDVGDLLDDLLVETWGSGPAPQAESLPAWLVARLHERIDAAVAEAEIEQLGSDEVFVDDWIRDNASFWIEGPELLPEEPAADDGLDPHEVASIVEHVTTEERRALLLHGVEGVPIEAIAEALSVSESEAEALVERATEQLLRASADDG